MTAEHVFILYQGEAPDLDELTRLVKVVEREAGDDLTGVEIDTYPVTDPTERLAEAMAARLRVEDTPADLSTYTIEARAGRRVVGVTWSHETAPWVRHTIPAHLAKLAGTGLAVTHRAGWARLTTEPALAFVASAADGATRLFPDVRVVVSVLPETSPWRLRRLMPGGYLTWVDGVFQRAGVRLGEIDVAHWLVRGGRVVHLAYLPKDGSTAVLPWDLLTRAEKRGGRKRA